MDYFKDCFTGRVVESISEMYDDQHQACVQFTFLGTPQKLRIYSARSNEVPLPAKIWVDDEDTDKYHNFK